MESWVKFCSPQNISGASQQFSFSKTAETDGDLFYNVKKKKKKDKMAPYSSSSVIQISRSPNIPN